MDEDRYFMELAKAIGKLVETGQVPPKNDKGFYILEEAPVVTV